MAPLLLYSFHRWLLWSHSFFKVSLELLVCFYGLPYDLESFFTFHYWSGSLGCLYFKYGHFIFQYFLQDFLMMYFLWFLRLFVFISFAFSLQCSCLSKFMSTFSSSHALRASQIIPLRCFHHYFCPLIGKSFLWTLRTILCLRGNGQFTQRLLHRNDQYQSIGKPVQNDVMLNNFWSRFQQPKTQYNRFDQSH